MNPTLPCYKSGVSDSPHQGTILPPDRFAMYRNSEIAKLGSLRNQILRNVVLCSVSGYICFRASQSIDSEKNLWSISVRVAFISSGIFSVSNFCKALQKYCDYIAARQTLRQKIDAYPKHFSLREKRVIDRLVTPEEFQEIKPYLPIGTESIEIVASVVREWTIGGGQMLLGSFTTLRARQGQVIESNEELLFRKSRPWIDLALMAARSQAIPKETKEELIRVTIDLIAPGQLFSAVRLERKPGEIRFFSRPVEEGEKVIFASIDKEIIRFSKAEMLKAFLIRNYVAPSNSEEIP